MSANNNGQIEGPLYVKGPTYFTDGNDSVGHKTMNTEEDYDLESCTDSGCSSHELPASEKSMPQQVNPFSKRKGHLFEWSGVQVSAENSAVGGEDDQKRKDILSDQCGRVCPGQLCAIMGHSGSGKTTLMNVLAGRTAMGSHPSGVKVGGKITMDNKEIDTSSMDVRRKIAFVPQHQSLYATATPREALYFAARLRLPRKYCNEAIKALANDMLKKLGLLEVADVPVGDEAHKGISGGEMRRLSLGVELVTQPSLVFLDEITSGLDSHNAYETMKVCKRVAQAGATVVMIIHQPSGKIFDMVDNIILLTQGRCLYQGPASQVGNYFSNRGLPIPESYSAADWMLEASQTIPMGDLEECGFFTDFPLDDHDTPHSTDVEESILVSRSNGSPEPSSALQKKHRIRRTEVKGDSVSSWQTFCFLLKRSILDNIRSNNKMRSRLRVCIFAASLFAILFAGAGKDSLSSSAAFQAHIGALFMVLFQMSGLLPLILVDVIDERPIFVREFSTNHYKTYPYAFSGIFLESVLAVMYSFVTTVITHWAIGFQASFQFWWFIKFILLEVQLSLGSFIGSVTKDPAVGREIVPLLFALQIGFSGFMIQQDQLPSWLQWAVYISPITYAARLVLNKEFTECANPDSPKNLQSEFERCSSYLVDNHANGQFNTMYWVVLIAFYVVFRALAAACLRRQAMLASHG